MYCRRCGAPLHQGLVVCPECGSRQRRRFSAVRCAECGGRVALGLSVCPHCGRNLRPAGPRWGLWLAGSALIAVAALWGLGELPVDKILSKVAAARDRVAGVVEVLGPAASSFTSIGSNEPATIAQVPESDSEEVVVTGSGPLPVDSESTPGAGSLLDIATPDITPAASEVGASEGVTATLTADAEQSPALDTPTVEPTPTATHTPTLEPTATATETAPPPSPTPPPTAAPAQAGRTTYRVQSGDTLSSIATKFGITWQDLAAANNLTSRSVLRIGQELVIPAQGGAPVSPTNTPQPRSTARPTAAPATPQPALAAPVLRSPGDQTPFNGPSSFELDWDPVPGFPVGATYRVTVAYTDQDAQAQQRWWDTTADGVLIVNDLYQKAAQPARKYTWYVTVVQITTDGQGGEKVIPLSPPSQPRVFYWH